VRFAWLGFVADEDGNVRATHHESLADSSSSGGASHWRKCATSSCFAEGTQPDGQCYVHTSVEHRGGYLDTRRGETRIGGAFGVPFRVDGRTRSTVPKRGRGGSS
jgi:hypothetical protein